MAELLVQGRSVPMQTDLKCPVCEEPLRMETLIDIASGSSRIAGSRGFRQTTVTVNVETKIKGFRIHHTCDYKEPES